jgi:hypothetical protein
MQGLIFFVWEKFLSDRFGNEFITHYHNTIKQAVSDAPLVSYACDLEPLQVAIQGAARLSKTETKHILYEYGRYFMVSPLVHQIYGYLFSQAQNTYEMISLISKLSKPKSQLNENMASMLFSCKPIVGNGTKGIRIIYNGNSFLCPLLYGTIAGAGEHVKEHLNITERLCRHKGHPYCQFDVIYENTHKITKVLVMQEQRDLQQHIENRILQALPDTPKEAISLLDLQKHLNLRPFNLVNTIEHLQLNGQIGMHPAQEMMYRRYWRI